MKKLDPNIRKLLVISSFVLTLGIVSNDLISKANNERFRNSSLDIELVSENVDKDTIKVSLDNITEIPKAIQFSIKLDDKVQAIDIKNILTSENNDILFNFENNNNQIDILATSNSNFNKIGNKLEIMEIDILPNDSEVKDLSFEVIAINTNDYKYVNNNSIEFGEFNVINTSKEVYFSVDDILGEEEPDEPQGETLPDIKPDEPQEETLPEIEPDEPQGETLPEIEPDEPQGETLPDIKPETEKPLPEGEEVLPNKPDTDTSNPEEVKPLPFKDVLDNHWARDYIYDFVQKGYIEGYEDNTFRPNQDITRAEFIKIVNKSFGYEQKSGIIQMIRNLVRKGVMFTDINEDAWYYEYLEVAVDKGYIDGYEDNTFRPNDKITRQEASKIVAVIRELTGDGVINFKDKDEISNWAQNYVDALEDSKIIEGYEDNTFRPKSNITRAEAVKILSIK
ncbi:MAG: S-layer homology domain-containing protein [Peptostreptococcaceae bacterium]